MRLHGWFFNYIAPSTLMMPLSIYPVSMFCSASSILSPCWAYKVLQVTESHYMGPLTSSITTVHFANNSNGLERLFYHLISCCRSITLHKTDVSTHLTLDLFLLPCGAHRPIHPLNHLWWAASNLFMFAIVNGVLGMTLNCIHTEWCPGHDVKLHPHFHCHW